MSNHLSYQVLTVDSAGWVRQHLLTPLAQNEPGAFSESELLLQMRGFKRSPFRTGENGGVFTPKRKNSAIEPVSISPAHIDQESLCFSPAK